MSRFHSAFTRFRDYLTPASHTSNFATTGELTPEEFVAAGDYLCLKFPTWSWAPSADPSQKVDYLPEDKQYLVLKHAPCHSRLDDGFVGWNPGEEDEWDGGEDSHGQGKVKAVGEAEGAEPEEEDEDSDDEIPDMDDEEDDEEAIIRDDSGKKRVGKGVKAPLRYYNLYLTYTTWFRVPRLYISGFDGATNTPLHPPQTMFEDIAPDYREKTVTIEPFPYLGAPVQMASVHPCKHAETMKRIFDGMARRKARRDAEKEGEGEVIDRVGKDEVGKEGGKGGEADEWEQIAADGSEEGEDGGLRVDQYLVVFVKFMAGVMPGVEMDYTMGI